MVACHHHHPFGFYYNTHLLISNISLLPKVCVCLFLLVFREARKRKLGCDPCLCFVFLVVFVVVVAAVVFGACLGRQVCCCEGAHTIFGGSLPLIVASTVN